MCFKLIQLDKDTSELGINFFKSIAPSYILMHMHEQFITEGTMHSTSQVVLQ